MISYENIRRVHLEISTRCNAKCPLCPRNLAGFETDLGYPIHDMSLSEAKNIFSEPFLQQLQGILINGNFGDFVTARDGFEIVKYFTDTNPTLKIEISTNASARPKIWSELGKIKNVTIGFDIDGLEDTHHLYRQNTNWNLVISNAKNFINSGGTAIWRMIVFDHNKHQVEDCRKLSKELGFKQFNIINDGRDSGPVYNSDGNLTHILIPSTTEIKRNYPQRIETWAEWSSRNPVWPIEPARKEKNCATKNYNEIYIAANGEVYPCCWLGFYPNSKFRRNHYGDDELLKTIVTNNNANQVGIRTAIEYFTKIEQAWQLDYYSEGRIFTCDEYCGLK